MLAIWNDRVEKAVELWDEVYEYNSVGGGLHVVLDDHNFSNELIQSLIDEGFGKYGLNDNQDNQAGQIETETELARHLLTMTMAEKLSAQAYHDTARYGIMKREDGTVHMRQDLMYAYVDELESEGILEETCIYVCKQCGEIPDKCKCSPNDPQKLAENDTARKAGREQLARYVTQKELENVAQSKKDHEDLASRQRRCDGCGHFYANCTCCAKCGKAKCSCDA